MMKLDKSHDQSKRIRVSLYHVYNRFITSVLVVKPNTLLPRFLLNKWIIQLLSAALLHSAAMEVAEPCVRF